MTAAHRTECGRVCRPCLLAGDPKEPIEGRSCVQCPAQVCISRWSTFDGRLSVILEAEEFALEARR